MHTCVHNVLLFRCLRPVAVAVPGAGCTVRFGSKMAHWESKVRLMTTLLLPLPKMPMLLLLWQSVAAAAAAVAGFA